MMKPTHPTLEAAEAYAAYAAMQRAEAKDPSLPNNPYWKAVRDSAYARFRLTYEGR